MLGIGGGAAVARLAAKFSRQLLRPG